jgi:hypothetical protein
VLVIIGATPEAKRSSSAHRRLCESTHSWWELRTMLLWRRGSHRAASLLTFKLSSGSTYGLQKPLMTFATVRHSRSAREPGSLTRPVSFLVSASHISCQRSLGVGLVGRPHEDVSIALRQLVEDVDGLVPPSNAVAHLRPYLLDRLPEAERSVGDREFRADRKPTPPEGASGHGLQAGRRLAKNVQA